MSSTLFAHGEHGGPDGSGRSSGPNESAFGSPRIGPVHTIAVIGVGYVGLPTAATLAHLGHLRGHLG